MKKSNANAPQVIGVLHADIAATALLLQSMAERTRELLTDGKTPENEISVAMRQLVDIARSHVRAIGDAHLDEYLRMTDEMDGLIRS